MRQGLIDIIEAQRGSFLLWMPVWMGIGIATYFGLSSEALAGRLVVVAAGGALASVTAVITRGYPRAFSLAILMVAAGFVLAAARAHLVAAPRLDGRYHGPVSGRIVAIDRSASGHLRLLLDRIRLARDAPVTPHLARVTIWGDDAETGFAPGQIVGMTASLSPPPPPAEPGGFDFRRLAWFRGLGAVGFARRPPRQIARPRLDDWNIRLAARRFDMAQQVRRRLDGQAGAFAAALLTGDRSAVDPAVLQQLRDSNLAHLLAISGLHMGLLAGFVFAALRYGAALVPPVALRLPVKQIAAGVALLAGLAYMVLSGASIATQRAFVMLAVFLVAVMLSRRALSLRAVALAAVVVLAIRPESLLSVGFQMSFAATAALIAVFSALQNSPLARVRSPILRWGAGLVVSSITAGAATAPFAAFHFNRLVAFGLVANLMSIPAMGLIVMPAAVCAMLADMLGLGAPFWAVMGMGIDWILGVAARVSSWPGAVRPVPAGDGAALVMISVAGLALILLRGRVRAVGIIPLVAGLVIWAQTPRPDLLLSDSGMLVGAVGPQGRWLSRGRGSGFVAQSWLRRDGDGVEQPQAAARPPPRWLVRVYRKRKRAVWRKGGGGVALFTGRKIAATDLARLCADFRLVVLSRLSAPRPPGGCRFISHGDLQRDGAVAVWLNGKGVPPGRELRIVTARQLAGQRLWTLRQGFQ